MSTFVQVNPASFINTKAGIPDHGRGAWSRAGIGTDYRFYYRAGVRVGNEAEKSLDHWAVSAGVNAIQLRLIATKFLTPRTDALKGNFGSATRDAVIAFQTAAGLQPIGIVGHGTAQALWTPLIDAAEKKYAIPDRLLRGMIAHESGLDPAAVGYYIYYPDFRGVDRGLAQINSVQQPNTSYYQAYDPVYAIEYAAKRMQTTFVNYSREFSKRPVSVLWDATVCAHNSPVRALQWLQTGTPSPEAAKYVAYVKTARY